MSENVLTETVRIGSVLIGIARIESVRIGSGTDQISERKGKGKEDKEMDGIVAVNNIIGSGGSGVGNVGVRTLLLLLLLVLSGG